MQFLGNVMHVLKNINFYFEFHRFELKNHFKSDKIRHDQMCQYLGYGYRWSLVWWLKIDLEDREEYRKDPRYLELRPCWMTTRGGDLCLV